MATLRLSLVIPVYNEAHHIKGCLEAIKNQTIAPFEVIVVDNNCTDTTLDIAKQYSFVKVVKETRQGRGWARSMGFDAARGEIIGRIDADSRIAPDWVQHALADFEGDDELAGITGLAMTVTIPRVRILKSTFWSRSYYWFVHASFRTITLWGADMALRKSAWLAVRNAVCNDDNLVHEDQDVSMEVAALGLKLEQDNELRIVTGGQTYNYLPKLLHYYHLQRSTVKRHRDKGNLSSKRLRRLSLLSVMPGVLLAIPPGIFMCVASIILWPLDTLMIELGRQKTWLD